MKHPLLGHRRIAIQFASRILIIGALFATFGCSSAPTMDDRDAQLKKMQQDAETELSKRAQQIAPGFLIGVRHPEDSKISGEYKVEFSGDLNLPYEVKVRAAGLTLPELRDRITNAYSQFFTAKSQVKVEIVKRQYWVELRGLVQKPGRYLVQKFTSLEEVVAMAGGFSGDSKNDKTDSKPEYVKIVLPDFENPTKAAYTRWIRLADYFARTDTSENIVWYGGERIFFQTALDPGVKMNARSFSIRIMGEVARPGEYDIRSGDDIYTYISRAGGPTTNADLGEVKIVRKGIETTDEINLLKGRPNVALEPGDVILVKSMATKPSSFEKGLSILATVAGIVTPILLIVLVL